MDSGSVFAILHGRRRMVVAAMVVGSLAGVGLNVVMAPVYRARVRIEIRRPPDASLRGPASFQSELVSMYTAAEMITSRGLLSRIADEYRGRGWIRGGRPASDGLGGVMRRLGDPDIGFGGGRKAPTAPAPTRMANDLGSEIDWLQTIVAVRPVRDTRLVDVLVEHTDSTAARVIAGRIGELFEGYARGTATPAADSSASLAAGGEASGPAKPAGPVLDRPGMQARLRMLNTNLADLTRAHRQAEDDRLEAEAQLERLRRGAGDTAATDWAQVPDPGGSLGSLRRDLRDCQARLASARTTYGPRHPHLQEMERECTALRANVQREINRAIADQRGLVASRAARERDLGDELARTERGLRAALAADPGDAAASAEAQEVVATVPAIEIVDGPMVEPRPVRPHRLMNVAVGGLAAALLASAFALWRLGDPRTLRTPEEVEAELGLPVLGLIPRRPRLAPNRGMS